MQVMSGTDDPDSAALRETLLRLENDGWQALCEGAGADFYGRLMREDGVMVLANGVVLDRASVTASLHEAPSWDGYEISDVQLVPIGNEAAALLYRASAWRRDDEPFRAVMCSVYADVGGRPRLALYQQTVMAGDRD